MLRYVGVPQHVLFRDSVYGHVMLYEIPDGFALRVIERSVYWSKDLDPDRVGVQVFVPQPFGYSGMP